MQEKMIQPHTCLILLVCVILVEQFSKRPLPSLAALIVCGAVLVAAVVYRFFAHVKTPNQPNRYRKMVIALAFVAVLTSVVFRWPARLRLYVSQPAFNKVMNEMHAGHQPYGYPRWVGLYWVQRVYDNDYGGDGPIGFVTGWAHHEVGLQFGGGQQFLGSDAIPIGHNWYLTEW